jgi:hypothetical protein
VTLSPPDDDRTNGSLDADTEKQGRCKACHTDVGDPRIGTFIAQVPFRRLPARLFVPLRKRLLPIVVLLVAGLSVPGEAQIVRGRRVRPVVVVSPFYYASPFWYGYPWYGYPWFPYQYPIGPYPYYPYYAIDSGTALRLEVKPKEAEVYVDGYYAGIVDDYDGVFQRLHVRPGSHDIALYLDGYRTTHQSVYLTPRSTFKLRYTMQPLAPGDVAESRPTPQNPPTAEQPAPGPPPPPGGRGRRVPPPDGGVRGAEVSASATLAIRVQPPDAAILIDGERWEGSQGQERLVVQVSEGPHRIQAQRDGYEPFSTEVVLRRGETRPINISLRSR